MYTRKKKEIPEPTDILSLLASLWIAIGHHRPLLGDNGALLLGEMLVAFHCPDTSLDCRSIEQKLLTCIAKYLVLSAVLAEEPLFRRHGCGAGETHIHFPGGPSKTHHVISIEFGAVVVMVR